MNFIISIIVGAVIGYITNWLAIKMLFRPHNKIEVFGLPMPFTPGLIPKERDRIAKSIGTTIGVHLLTSDVFTEVLSGDKVNGQLQTWIRDKINNLRNSDKTVSDLLTNLFGDKGELILSSVENKAAAFICTQLAKETFIDKLIDFVEKKIFIKHKVDFQVLITEKVENFIKHLSASPELREGLEGIIASKLKELEKDDRAVSKAIPAELIDIIYTYVSSHKREIALGLGQLLKNPFIKMKLKAAIADIISQNTSKVVTVFFPPESIAQKVISALEAYFENGENDDSILSVIKTLMDKILKTKVSNFFKEISGENKKQVLTHIVDASSDYILSNEVHRKVSDIINSKLIMSEQDIKENLLCLLKDKIGTLARTPEFNESIQKLIHEIIDAIKNTSVSNILEKADDNTISKIIEVLKDVYSSFIKNKLPKAIKALDISSIVEEKINSFDAIYVEELILEIASKELKAITWLGALLGGIMGLISPLLQLII